MATLRIHYLAQECQGLSNKLIIQSLIFPEKCQSVWLAQVEKFSTFKLWNDLHYCLYWNQSLIIPQSYQNYTRYPLQSHVSLQVSLALVFLTFNAMQVLDHIKVNRISIILLFLASLASRNNPQLLLPTTNSFPFKCYLREVCIINLKRD